MHRPWSGVEEAADRASQSKERRSISSKLSHPIVALLLLRLLPPSFPANNSGYRRPQPPTAFSFSRPTATAVLYCNQEHRKVRSEFVDRVCCAVPSLTTCETTPRNSCRQSQELGPQGPHGKASKSCYPPRCRPASVSTSAATNFHRFCSSFRSCHVLSSR